MKPFFQDDAITMAPAWSHARGTDGDVVVSTRMRLARNVAIAPFPGQATDEDLERVAQACRAPFEDSADFCDFRLLDVAAMDPVTLRSLVERHLVSARLLSPPEHRYAILSPTGTLAVMVNEEDHLRMQCFLPGRDIKGAWNILDRLDDWLSATLPWCFSPRYGYLTTHLANLGTGLRASAMVHLPALETTGRRDETLRAAASLGVAVRGLYGEGSQSAGDLFQVSNRFALGPAEEEIVGRVDTTAKFLVGAERQARRRLLDEEEGSLADAAWRAYGILMYARRLTTAEALDLLSKLKLGLDLNLLNVVARKTVQSLFLAVRPASLQAASGRTLDPKARDRARADLIRHALGGDAAR
ncbi:MAG TPA: ATP--guanido phosphotransferase [Armatimonadota bacterium]